ncbi:hypothetical protein [Emticicia sp.]|uniref:hypothetical protein n=1 Tax=Emticicia sp. TaxID=1930953 RepID=UPI003752C620
MEHSGSMYFYDGPSVKGQFKNTLVTLMQGFEKVKPKIPKVFIVNDKVYPYPKDFEQLITSKSIFETKIGNSGFTDFQTIFSTILADLKQDQMGILFSDLIYSGKNSQGKSAQKIMDEAEQLCQMTFSPNAANTSVLIIKLHSDYQGVYYSYNSPNKGKTYKGNRPYYVCLFAKNQTMEKFLKDGLYSQIRSFEQLPDFQNKIFFSNGSFLSAPYYTILQNDSEGKGSFNKGDRDLNKNGLHVIKDVKPSHRSTDKLTICVAVSFPKGALEESEITNIENYQIDGFKDGFKLKTVKSLNRTDGTTHKLILEASKVARGEREVTIKFKRNFPPKWVTDTHSSDDTNINPKSVFATQTFGINSIMKGLDNSFNLPKSSSDKNYYFTLTLKLED